MNIFRLTADLMHLASILLLILKITKTRSAQGISFKTQVLYAVVFVCRYLDLFVHFVSLYNTLMKIFFIGSAVYIVYLMHFRLRATWDPKLDTFRLEYILGPCAILALIWNYDFTVMEVLWSFSIFLESVAILPQLFQLQRTGEAETITTHYMFFLGAYRGLYLLNWIWRFITEGYVDAIAETAGVLQTALYADFFYVYFTRVMKGALVAGGVYWLACSNWPV